MKKLFFFFALGLSTSGLFSQNTEAYRQLNALGDSLFQNKNFVGSARAFRGAMEANDGKATKQDNYITGLSYSMAEKRDSAFYYLEIALKMGYNEPYQFIDHPYLKAISGDRRWAGFAKRVKESYAKTLALRDPILAPKLKAIFDSHQEARKSERKTRTMKEATPAEIAAHKAKIRQTDSLNRQEIALVLDEKGWLAPQTIGDTGTLAIYTVLLNSPFEFQEKYLPMMREAVKNGFVKQADLAMLEDRFLTNQGKPQIYGTQVKRVTGGKLVPLPIEDEKNVDKRRFEVGLGTMDSYMKGFHMTYEPPKE